MYAFAGDQIFVTDRRTAVTRHGEVVSGDHPDGHPPFWVRWQDTGEEELWFPCPDAAIEHAGPTYPPEYVPDRFVALDVRS